MPTEVGPRDVPEGGDPPIASALKWPPCKCPRYAEGSDSPSLSRLRSAVREDNERRSRFRTLGRPL